MGRGYILPVIKRKGTIMAEKAIDWTKPIEAYHPDGRVQTVKVLEVWPGGAFFIDTALDYKHSVFLSSGAHRYGFKHTRWRIRNVVEPATHSSNEAVANASTTDFEALVLGAVRNARPIRGRFAARWQVVSEMFVIDGVEAEVLCSMAGVGPRDYVFRKGYQLTGKRGGK